MTECKIYIFRRVYVPTQGKVNAVHKIDLLPMRVSGSHQPFVHACTHSCHLCPLAPAYAHLYPLHHPMSFKPTHTHYHPLHLFVPFIAGLIFMK